MGRLKGKVAIVTGASRGIGAAIAKTFAEEGAVVALSARTLDALERLRAKIERDMGGKAVVVRADMSQPQQIRCLMDEIAKKFGRIDILINNAGLPMFGYPIDSPSPRAEQRFKEIIQTNLCGYWYAARYAVPYMKKNGGVILNIASVRGHAGLANESAYCAAKGGVIMLTKALAVELARFRIRVNSISPGAIEVDPGHWVRSRYGEAPYRFFKEHFLEVHKAGHLLNQPLRMIGKPEDVAKAAVFLACEEARFVTGADLLVDGGELALLSEPWAVDLDAYAEFAGKARPFRQWLGGLENNED